MEVLQQALQLTPGGPVGHSTNCGNRSSAYTHGKMPSCCWNQIGPRCKTCLSRCWCTKPLNSHSTGRRRNICIRPQSTDPQGRAYNTASSMPGFEKPPATSAWKIPSLLYSEGNSRAQLPEQHVGSLHVIARMNYFSHYFSCSPRESFWHPNCPV